MPSKAHLDYMDAVEAALTDTVLLRVRHFAEARCRLLRSHGLSANASDMAHDAVQGTFEGTRPWNRKKCELHQHLQGVVSGHVSNIFRHSASEPVSGADERPINHDLASHIVAALSDLAKGSNDRQVLGIIDAWGDGVTERQDVAQRLGLSNKRVKTAQRRLLSLANKLPQPLRDGSPRDD